MGIKSIIDFKKSLELLYVSIINYNCEKYLLHDRNQLTVYDDMKNIEITCTVSNTTQTIISSGNYLQLHFLTNGDHFFSEDFSGFRGRYKEIDAEMTTGGHGLGI